MAYSTMIVNKAHGKKGSRGKVRVRGRRKSRNPRLAKGTPTELNLFALRDLFGDRRRVPNQIPPPDVPHIRRCFKAGLVAVDGRELVLTDAGVAALAERNPPIRKSCEPGRYRPKKGPSKGKCVPGIPTPRRGSLGGPGYTTKSATARRRILERHVKDYGYRSTISALQSRINLGSKTMGTKALAAFRADVKWLQSNAKMRNPFESVGEHSGGGSVMLPPPPQLTPAEKDILLDLPGRRKSGCPLDTKSLGEIIQPVTSAPKLEIINSLISKGLVEKVGGCWKLTMRGESIAKNIVYESKHGPIEHEKIFRRLADPYARPVRRKKTRNSGKRRIRNPDGDGVINIHEYAIGTAPMRVQAKRGMTFVSRNSGKPKYVLVVDAEDGDSWSAPFGAFLRDNKDSPDISEMKALRVGQTIGVGGGAAPRFEITGLEKKPKATRNPKRNKKKSRGAGSKTITTSEGTTSRDKHNRGIRVWKQLIKFGEAGIVKITRTNEDIIADLRDQGRVHVFAHGEHEYAKLVRNKKKTKPKRKSTKKKSAKKRTTKKNAPKPRRRVTTKRVVLERNKAALRNFYNLREDLE